jgi:small-conductance mechanosensitive channel
MAIDPQVVESWLRFAAIGGALVLAAMLAQRVVRRLVLRLAGYSTVASHVVRACERPLDWALPLVVLSVYWQGLPDDLRGIDGVRHVNSVLTIGAVTWLLMNAVRGLADGVVALHRADVADNLAARRVQTQTRVLARTAAGMVLLAGVAFVMMTFPRARQFGASLLASAGVAGLIVGIAARSVFSNLLAGLQIALAQPIRIDDVLIIEGEWGRVEEITATYVVLRIWDERRLIVPLQWFIEHPFQNWTRTSSDLLGTVFLWVDYTLPVEPIRAEAKRLCEGSPDWDRKVCVVQVTDQNERAMQLRILVSSPSSGQNFDLRCRVREGLIDYIRREHPDALPQVRSTAGAAAAQAAAAPPPA